jgi:hypothetical protein
MGVLGAGVKMLGMKLTREIKRLRAQISSCFAPVFGLLNRIRYDRRRAQSVLRTRGDMTRRDDMAVLVIFQPNGLLDTTFSTLDWLNRQDISTVVVSNLPLTSADRERLCKHAALVIERPNIGYDFGGYREG